MKRPKSEYGRLVKCLQTYVYFISMMERIIPVYSFCTCDIHYFIACVELDRESS